MHTINNLQLSFMLMVNSLTNALSELAQGTFMVKVHSCANKNLSCAEIEPEEIKELIEYLNINPSSSKNWQIREVYLYGEGVPWVFARSYALQSELKLANFDLCTLGDNSLGTHLYANPNLKRTPFELFEFELAPYGGLFTRQSVFMLDKLNIVVMEAFLPALWKKLGYI